MRAVRTLGWAVVGALPSVIALPGLIESQGENLGLVFGGFGLAIGFGPRRVLFFLIVVLVLATLGGVGCWRGVHELATEWLRFLFPWWV